MPSRRQFTAIAPLFLQTGCLQTGCREKPSVLNVGNLIFKRTALRGSITGGVPETQQMLDYCAGQNITADVEMIPSRKINEAFEHLLTQDAD